MGLFRPAELQDLTPLALSASFAKFTLPSKGEGYDEVKYEWYKTGSKCQEYLKQWISARKLSTRVEELVPSHWFNQKWSEWQKAVTQWKSKQNAYRAVVAKKAADREKKKVARAARAAARAKQSEAKQNEE